MPETFWRSDAMGKSTGSAVYGMDLAAAHMLHGGLVRSTVSCGIITSIDTTAAERLPGVVCVVAGDFPAKTFGIFVRDQVALAVDGVRYAGEPIVALAAPDLETLEAAKNAVVVTIDRRPGLFDTESALNAAASLVHPDWSTYGETMPIERHGNCCGASRIEVGDVDAAFERAALVVEGRYSTPRVHQGYVEPRSCLAWTTPDGGFLVQTSTQNPYRVRDSLAEIFEVPISKINVEAVTIGGGFGGKLDSTLEHFACALARKARRPVKMVSSRAEEFHASYPRDNASVSIASALDPDGTIIGRRFTMTVDAGAYAFDSPATTALATMQGAGPYRIPNVRSEAIAVYTNTQPTGAFRGPSGPAAALATECHMDEIADRLGVDRLEYRRRHFLRDGDRAINGQLITRPPLNECLDAVSNALEVDRPRPPGTAIGVACGWWTTTGGPTSATVRLEDDGTISIVTGAVEIGTGALAAGVVSICAEMFGVDVQSITLASTGDTGAGAYDMGAEGSRTTVNVGNAINRAAADLTRQILEEASQLLEIDPVDLEIRGGAVRPRGTPAAAITLAAIARTGRERSGPLHASARYVAPGTPHDVETTGPDHIYPAFHTPSFHCHGVEVAVDEATGRIELLKYVVAQDIGHAQVRPAVEGQVHGGVAQGIGMALYEEIRLIDGVVANPSLHDYGMPTIMEIPPFEIFFIENGDGNGHQGAKGVGEPPIIFPGAAIANAVSAALGVRCAELPITRDRVLTLVREAGRS